VIASCGEIDNPNFCIIFSKIELKCDTWHFGRFIYCNYV
jgi:hypothetical protein